MNSTDLYVIDNTVYSNVCFVVFYTTHKRISFYKSNLIIILLSYIDGEDII